MAPVAGAIAPFAVGLLDRLAENPAGLARQVLQGGCVLAVGTAIILGYRGYYLEKNGLISPADKDLFSLTDDPDEVLEIVTEFRKRLGVTPGIAPVMA